MLVLGIDRSPSCEQRPDAIGVARGGGGLQRGNARYILSILDPRAVLEQQLDTLDVTVHRRQHQVGKVGRDVRRLGLWPSDEVRVLGLLHQPVWIRAHLEELAQIFRPAIERGLPDELRRWEWHADAGKVKF